ncbi:right-handed parallel beta-helix repeat-containing protein [Methanomethylovorans sp.]|uniref:right-handed parallel beta-helix repeat-containing protein n=1 Tax=Methanomethylovorans sp. TaxID=2758717 RepID=UPI00351C36FC
MSLPKGSIVYVDTDRTGNYKCDGINDHVEINEALTYIDSIGGGTVYLRGPNTYWIDGTLEMGSNTILEGDSDACIKLVPDAEWGDYVPLITNMDGANENFTIKGFEIDGNSENQSVPRGSGYYDMIYFYKCTDITVTDMRMEWGTSDGLIVRNYFHDISSNIVFTNNSVYKLGHEALYTLGLNGVTVANNNVFTRTNTAFRLSSSGHAKIYNNIIHSEIADWSTGPGIEIDKSSGYPSEDIEIYKNTIHTLNGAGIWIFGEDTDNVVRGKDVYVHHNIFYDVGQYDINTGYSNSAIIIGQFDNTRIENNVIDNGGHAGIKYYKYPKSASMDASFTTVVRNNIIVGSDEYEDIGLWNTDSANHTFISNNNGIYNVDRTYDGNSIVQKDDIYVDPLFADASKHDFHLKSTAGRWSGKAWVTDSVTSPLIDSGYLHSNFSLEPKPNGNRINIGRYGNTDEASKSPST